MLQQEGYDLMGAAFEVYTCSATEWQKKSISRV